jgi:hypothetical protein
MIDCPVLIKDLQGALSTTLRMYANIEKVRISAFNKKFSLNSAQNMQKINNELEKIQVPNEIIHKNKRMLPVLSQKMYPRTKTPVLVSSISQKSRNYLQKYIRASNSRLCSSRAGNTERNLNIEPPEEYFETDDKSKDERKECNLEEMFGQVHQLGKSGDGIKEEGLKRNAGGKLKVIENPESGLVRYIDSFKRVKEEQNAQFLKKIQRKIFSPGPELTRRRIRNKS